MQEKASTISSDPLANPDKMRISRELSPLEEEGMKAYSCDEGRTVWCGGASFDDSGDDGSADDSTETVPEDSQMDSDVSSDSDTVSKSGE